MEILLTGAILAYMYTCAMVSSRIAARKGRGTDEWFACGLILGVIAVMAILPLPELVDMSRRSSSPDASG